jgi:hypothetical protein
MDDIFIDPYFKQVKHALFLMYVGALHEKRIMKELQIDSDTYYHYRFLLSSEYGESIRKRRMIANDILYYRKQGYSSAQVALRTRQHIDVIKKFDREIFIPLNELLSLKIPIVKKIKVKKPRAKKVNAKVIIIPRRFELKLHKESKEPNELKVIKAPRKSKRREPSISHKRKKTLEEKLAEIDNKENEVSEDDIKGKDSLFCDTEFLEQFLGRKLDRRECE